MDSSHTTVVVVSLAALLACSDGGPVDVSTPPVAPAPITSFSFLLGGWTSVGQLDEPGGAPVVSEGQASATASLSDRAIKIQWVGTRGGVPSEVAMLIVPSDNPAAYVMGRGDGEMGTFDVLEGSFSASEIILESRSGTRPDSGRARDRFFAINDSSFVLSRETSPDAGQRWTVEWEQFFSRLDSPPVLQPPATATGCALEEHGQFEFWAGDWSVGSATNDLRSVLAGCILEENWSGSEAGTSYNMFDPRSNLWNQIWTDTNGFTLVLTGGVQGRRMVMEGPRLGTRQRISWDPLPDSTVRQLGESSSDDGTTWAVLYDLTYVRR